jgi:hypothetical protein
MTSPLNRHRGAIPEPCHLRYGLLFWHQHHDVTTLGTDEVALPPTAPPQRVRQQRTQRVYCQRREVEQTKVGN